LPSITPAIPELLCLDGDPHVASLLPQLRESFRVTTPESVDSAIEYLRRAPVRPDILVTDLKINGHDTLPLIAAAKELEHPPSILITTSDVNRVPDAIVAGGDAILLKPFDRNLLFARLSRLKRARAEGLRMRVEHAIAKSTHLRERSLAAVGQRMISMWPNQHCPHCGATPVTCFDFVSHRRAWYACLACKKVWIAKRLE